MVLGLTERACGGRSTLVTVRRTRLVEDGYRQLAALPSRALRAAVRVRFINEQGLDEAGIDQDGVFKGAVFCITNSFVLKNCYGAEA